jgi:cytochrome P450
MTETATRYPMQRTGCPFDPPPELRKREPMSRIGLWNGTNPWLVTRYADIRAVLADPRVSSDSDLPGFPHQSEATAARRARVKSFISMDDPQHAAIRRTLTGRFTIRRVEAMRPRIQQIVDDLIDAMLAGPKSADLVQAFALPVPSLVICELLGVPYADRDFFHKASRTIINWTSGKDAILRATEELNAYLVDLVRAKRTDPGDDLISTLVANQSATVEEIAATSQLLLVAGHETTANMIALGTVALLANPDQLAEVRESDDPAVVTGAVEELLRYLTIVHSGRRRVAKADIEVGGQLIRAGEGIICATDAGNRDDEAFPDPDTLDIHRSARHHLAFGYGVHQCLGQPLARVELSVVYRTLYRRIPTLELAVAMDDLPFKHDMLVYGVHELPIRW